METTKDGELAKHTHSIPSSSVLNLYIGHFLARWGSRFIQFSLIIFLLTAWFFSPLSRFCLGLIMGFCGVFTFYYCRKVVEILELHVSFDCVITKDFLILLFLFLYIDFFLHSTVLRHLRCFAFFCHLINCKRFVFHHGLCFACPNVEQFWCLSEFSAVIFQNMNFTALCLMRQFLGWNCGMLLWWSLVSLLCKIK